MNDNNNNNTSNNTNSIITIPSASTRRGRSADPASSPA